MRDLTTAFKTAMAASGGAVHVGCFVEIDYPSTPVRAWSGQTDITWDAKTWSGLGDLGGFSTVTHKVGPVAGNVTLTLNGINASLVSLGLLDSSQGSIVQIWLAAMTETAGTWAVVADPMRFFRGRLDTHRIIEGDEYDAIEANVETFLARLTRARTVRMTNAEQQRAYPGDLGMEYAGRISEGGLNWGIPDAPANGTTNQSGRRTSQNR